MKRLFVLLVFTMFMMIPMHSRSQTVVNYLTSIVSKGYGSDYVKGYMQPFSNALGSAMGQALYHRGYSKTFPRFDAGISAVYIFIPDEARSFVSPHNFQGEVPTLFGNDNPSITGAIPGFDKKALLLPMLQANIGLIGNLEATVRYAATKVDYLGDLKLYGGGLKYELSSLIPIPMFPLDFAIQAAYHKFTLGNILDSGTFSMNVQASASVPILPVDVYAGLGYDNSSLTVNTVELLSTSTLGKITIDGENKLHLNAGLSFTFLFFNAHVDYNIGKYSSLAGGLMIVL